jgi:hypothetical protein
MIRLTGLIPEKYKETNSMSQAKALHLELLANESLFILLALPCHYLCTLVCQKYNLKSNHAVLFYFKAKWH